jgi:hypothetical protein
MCPEITTNLLLDDFLVDFASGDIIIAGEGDVEIPLVVAKVEIDLSSVVQDIHLACKGQFYFLEVKERSSSPCSVGRIVPASMFMYGSILIAVTFNPVVFKRSPVEEAGAPFNNEQLKNARHTNDALPDSTNDSSRDENVLHSERLRWVVVAVSKRKTRRDKSHLSHTKFSRNTT